jgi:DnaK suppressor protein
MAKSSKKTSSAASEKDTAAPISEAQVLSSRAAAPVVDDDEEYAPAISESVLLASSTKSFDVSKLQPFNKQQYERLLQLRDAMLDTMAGVAHDNLRKHAEDTESHAFGQHQADAGSDAYDRDFALSLLSQEQDALYEIDEAISRLENGTYGTCEMSGKKIPRARLEAIPWARFTVECQSQIEQEQRAYRPRRGGSLFGLGEEDHRSEKEELDESDS